MDLTNMTPTERAAWHRSEAARIEAEERARRPALAAGQVWRGGKTFQGGATYIAIHAPKTGGIILANIVDGCSYSGANGFYGDGDSFEYLGLARDVLRVVPPKWEEERSLLLELESLYRGTSRPSVEMNTALWGLDMLRGVVPPDPPAPQVAPEPTGAELNYPALFAMAKQNAKIAASYLYPPGDSRIQQAEEAMAQRLFFEYVTP